MSQISTFSFDGGQEDCKKGATPAQLTMMESLETLWVVRELGKIQWFQMV